MPLCCRKIVGKALHHDTLRQRAAQVDAVDRPIPARALRRGFGVGAPNVAPVKTKNEIVLAVAETGSAEGVSNRVLPAHSLQSCPQVLHPAAAGSRYSRAEKGDWLKHEVGHDDFSRYARKVCRSLPSQSRLRGLGTYTGLGRPALRVQSAAKLRGSVVEIEPLAGPVRLQQQRGGVLPDRLELPPPGRPRKPE